MNDEDSFRLEGRLTVVLHYDVGELFVRADNLGASLCAERAGFSVSVEFPNADGKFGNGFSPPSALPVRGRHGEPGPDARYVVGVVQVQVDTHLDLGDEGPGDAGSALVRQARPAAESVVRALLDWARTTDAQVWLSPPHIKPQAVGPARLVNEAGETRYGYASVERLLLVFEPGQLPTGDVQRALEDPEVLEAESLLAEAQWAIWPTNDPDTKRAVLLAAIGLEVKAPAVLRAAADAPTRMLLDILFRRHDETPMSVNFLVNEVAEVILGESLKRHDGRLAKAVKALFDLRNDVAHRGQTPSVDEARPAVAAAQRVFEWLDARKPEPQP